MATEAEIVEIHEPISVQKIVEESRYHTSEMSDRAISEVPPGDLKDKPSQPPEDDEYISKAEGKQMSIGGRAEMLVAVSKGNPEISEGENILISPEVDAVSGKEISEISKTGEVDGNLLPEGEKITEKRPDLGVSIEDKPDLEERALDQHVEVIAAKVVPVEEGPESIAPIETLGNNKDNVVFDSIKDNLPMKNGEAASGITEGAKEEPDNQSLDELSIGVPSITNKVEQATEESSETAKYLDEDHIQGNATDQRTVGTSPSIEVNTSMCIIDEKVESFQANSLLEETPSLGGDENWKGENAEEMKNNITEEVHDRMEITCRTEATKEILIDNDIPKLAEEVRSESFKDDENKVEKSKQEDEQKEDLVPDEKDADENGEKLEKFESAAGESIANETSQTSENTWDVFNTLMMKAMGHEDSSEIEDKNADMVETLPEGKGNEATIAEVSSNDVEQGQTEGQAHKEISEESKILQEAEPEEKAEQSLHPISEETDKFPPEVVQNPAETPADEKEVRESIDNNEIEENGSTKEDLKLDAATFNASESKESIIHELETKTGESDVEAFAEENKQDSEAMPEDTEQVIINDKSHNEDGSSEPVIDESHESPRQVNTEEKMPEVQVREQSETAKASEDAETSMLEEEEICEQQPILIAEKEKEENDAECVTEDGLKADLKPESAEEVPDQNAQVDKENADVHDEEKLEKSEPEVGKNIEDETPLTSDDTKETLETSLMTHEDDLQIEEKGNGDSVATLVEVSRDNIDQVVTDEQGEQELPENEEDVKTLQESEPREKIEHSSQLISEETDAIPQEADSIQFLTEVAQNPVEARDEKQVTEAIENTTEENGSIEEDLKVDTETSEASKCKESIIDEQEIEVSEREVETFIKTDKLELEEDEEINHGVKTEGKEGDKNDEFHIGDGSPESSGEVPHESPQEVKTTEEMPEREVHEEHLATDALEDPEKHVVEEEEIKHQLTPPTDKVDEDSKEENVQIITEKEVHDEREVMFPTEVSSEVIKDSDISRQEEEERLEGLIDDDNKEEKSKSEDDTEFVTKDGQNEEHRPESAAEVTDRNYQVDEKDADKHEDKKLEKSESTAEESNTSETGQTSENIQIEDKSIDQVEALTEEKANEEKSFAAIAEASSDGIEQREVGEQAEEETLKNEDGSKISEPAEKVEHSLQLTPEETNEVTPEADISPCLVEGTVKNPEEALKDQEEVTEAADNNSFEEYGSTKKEEAEEIDQEVTIKKEEAEEEVHQPTLPADKMEEEPKEETVQIDTEKEVHDEPEVTIPAEVSNEFINDNDISKQEEEEILEGSKGDENKVETSKQEDDTECVTEDGQNEDQRPESAEELTHRNFQGDEKDADEHVEKLEKSESTEVTDRNFQVDEKGTDKHEEEKLENSESTADESNTSETGQTSENLHIEDKSTKIVEALTEEKGNEEKSFPTIAEATSDDIEQSEVGEKTEKDTLKNEDNSKISEPAEKVEHSLQLTPEVTDKVTPEADVNPRLIESAVKNPEEALEDQEEVAEAADNNSFEENGSTKKEEAEEVDQEPKNENKEEDTKQVIINKISNVGDGSPDTTEEESLESHKVETEEETPAIEVHEQQETTNTSEENDKPDLTSSTKDENVKEISEEDESIQTNSKEEVSNPSLELVRDTEEIGLVEETASQTLEDRPEPENARHTPDITEEDKGEIIPKESEEDPVQNFSLKSEGSENTGELLGKEENCITDTDSKSTEIAIEETAVKEAEPEENTEVGGSDVPLKEEGLAAIESEGNDLENMDINAKSEDLKEVAKDDTPSEETLEGLKENSEMPLEEQSRTSTQAREANETSETHSSSLVEEQEIIEKENNPSNPIVSPVLEAVDRGEESVDEVRGHISEDQDLHTEQSAETYSSNTENGEVSKEEIRDEDENEKPIAEAVKHFEPSGIREDGDKDIEEDVEKLEKSESTEVAERNFQVDEKDAEKHEEEKLEKSESTAEESNASETGQTSESLRIEDKSIDTVEALTEEKDNEEKSFSAIAEASSDGNEQSEVGQQAEEGTLKNEDDSKISEPAEKVEHSLQLTPEETAKVTPEANVNPCLIESAVKNPEEALEDQEEVAKTADNSSFEENGSTKKEEAEEMDQEVTIKKEEAEEEQQPTLLADKMEEESKEETVQIITEKEVHDEPEITIPAEVSKEVIKDDDVSEKEEQKIEGFIDDENKAEISKQEDDTECVTDYGQNEVQRPESAEEVTDRNFQVDEKNADEHVEKLEMSESTEENGSTKKEEAEELDQEPKIEDKKEDTKQVVINEISNIGDGSPESTEEESLEGHKVETEKEKPAIKVHEQHETANTSEENDKPDLTSSTEAKNVKEISEGDESIQTNSNEEVSNPSLELVRDTEEIGSVEETASQTLEDRPEPENARHTPDITEEDKGEIIPKESEEGPIQNFSLESEGSEKTGELLGKEENCITDTDSKSTEIAIEETAVKEAEPEENTEVGGSDNPLKEEGLAAIESEGNDLDNMDINAKSEDLKEDAKYDTPSEETLEGLKENSEMPLEEQSRTSTQAREANETSEETQDPLETSETQSSSLVEEQEIIEKENNHSNPIVSPVLEATDRGEESVDEVRGHMSEDQDLHTEQSAETYSSNTENAEVSKEEIRDENEDEKPIAEAVKHFEPSGIREDGDKDIEEHVEKLEKSESTEVAERNFQVDEKDAEKHEEEKLEKSESTAEESNTSETGQTSESLQIEDKSIDTVEALTEEKSNEEKSFSAIPEASSDDIEQSEIVGLAEKETLMNEDDTEISEPAEKVEHSLQLTPEETDKVTPEVDINPCLIEGAVKNPEEALEEVTEAANNSSFEENGSTKKEEAEEMDQKPKNEDKEEDTKQVIINEISNVGDGSPETTEEESLESHKVETEEETPAIEVHEQQETANTSEENDKPDLTSSTKDENVKEISEEDESTQTNSKEEVSNPSLELVRDTAEIGSVEETTVQTLEDRPEPENSQHTPDITEEDKGQILPEETEEGPVQNPSLKSEVSENTGELLEREENNIVDTASQSTAVAIEETEVREAEPEGNIEVGGSDAPLKEEGLAATESTGNDLDSMDINAKDEDLKEIAKVDTPSEETLESLKETSEFPLEEQSCASTQAREANETSEETQDPLETSETQSRSLVEEQEIIEKENIPSNPVVSPVLEAVDRGEESVDEVRGHMSEDQDLHTEQSTETYSSNTENAEVSKEEIREEYEHEKTIDEAAKHFEPSGIVKDGEKDIEEPEKSSTDSVGCLKDDTGKEKEANESEKSDITLPPNDEVSQPEENPKQEESDHKPETADEDQINEAIQDTNKSQKEEETNNAQIHEVETLKEELETDLKTEDPTDIANEIIAPAILSREVGEEDKTRDDSENSKDVIEESYIENYFSAASTEDKTVQEEKDDRAISVERNEGEDSNEQIESANSEVKEDSSSGGEASLEVKEIVEEKDGGNGDSSSPAKSDAELGSKEVEQDKYEATSFNSASTIPADVDEHVQNEYLEKPEVIERDTVALNIPGEQVAEDIEKAENIPTIEIFDEAREHTGEDQDLPTEQSAETYTSCTEDAEVSKEETREEDERKMSIPEDGEKYIEEPENSSTDLVTELKTEDATDKEQNENEIIKPANLSQEVGKEEKKGDGIENIKDVKEEDSTENDSTGASIEEKTIHEEKDVSPTSVECIEVEDSNEMMTVESSEVKKDSSSGEETSLTAREVIEESKEVEQEKPEATPSNSASVIPADVQKHVKNEELDKSEVIERDTGALDIPREPIAEETEKAEDIPTVENPDETPSIHPELAGSRSSTLETSQAVELEKNSSASDASNELQDKGIEENAETGQSPAKEKEDVPEPQTENTVCEVVAAEKSIMLVQSPADNSDALKEEEARVEGPTTSETVRGDDISADHALIENKSDEQILTSRSASVSEEQERETEIVAGEKEEKSAVDLGNLNDASPKDSSEATEEIHLQHEVSHSFAVKEEIEDSDVDASDSKTIENAEKSEMTADQTSMEVKPEEGNLVATSALPSNEQQYEDETAVGNTEAQTSSAEKSDNEVQENEHGAGILAKTLEDNKTEAVEYGSALVEDSGLKEEPTEPEVATEDAVIVDQAPVEEKAEKPDQEVENADGQTPSAENPDQEVQEDEHGAVILAKTLEDNKTEAVETESALVEDSGLKKEPTELQVATEDAVIVDQAPMEEKTEEQSSSAEKPDQEFQEDEHGVVTLAKTLEDDKSEAVEDESALVEDSGPKKEPTEPQVATEDAVIVDQAPVEEKAEEQTSSAEKPNQEVQEEHGAVTLAKKLEDDKNEKAAVAEDESAQDAKDSKTESGIEDDSAHSNLLEVPFLQKEPSEPEAGVEDEVTADQAPVEEKAEEQNQTAISAMPSMEPECEVATAVRNADDQTQAYSSQNSAEDVQEEEHGAVIPATKLEDKPEVVTQDEISTDQACIEEAIEVENTDTESSSVQILERKVQEEEPGTVIPAKMFKDDGMEEAAITEGESTGDAEDSKTVENSCLQNEGSEPEAILKDENTSDRIPTEEMAEQSQIAISTLPSTEQEGESAPKVENVDGQTDSAKKSEEHEELKIAETKEDNIMQGTEVIESESARDASFSNEMNNLCTPEESTDPEAIKEHRVAVESAPDEKPEEVVQTANSEIPFKEQGIEGATRTANIPEEMEESVNADGVLLEKGMLQELEPVRQEEIISQKEEEPEMIGDEGSDDASDANATRDLCLQKVSLELEAAQGNEPKAEHLVADEKQERIQVTSSALQVEEGGHLTTIQDEETGEDKLKEEEIHEREFPEAKSIEEKCSEKEVLQSLEVGSREEIIADQAQPSEELRENEATGAALKLQEQNMKEPEKEMLQDFELVRQEEIISQKEEEPEMIEDESAKDGAAAGQTFSTEHFEKLQISAPALTPEDKWETREVDEPKKSGDSNEEIKGTMEVTQATHETFIQEEPMKAHDERKDGYQGEEKNAAFSITTNKAQNEELLEETQKVDASDTVEEFLAEGRRIEEPNSPSSVVMTETTTVSKEESGATILEKESTKGLGESTENINDARKIEKTTNEASDKQIPREVDLAETTGTMASSELAPVEKDRAAEVFEHAGERKGSEDGEEKRPDTADDKAAEISLAELLHKSRKETPPMADEKQSPKASNESPKIEVKTTPVKEEKDDEAEDNKNKKSDSDPDSPVMVEVPRDANIKNPHKKSHTILSGVGSKVKHTIISKVKKAFTCGSPHMELSEHGEKPSEHKH